ncbi:MAG: 4Fe-4S binding protein, partial [Planctomycetaceae bacterium]|nr:4Fe-4S binding protein [Planctomycetaceae bacterium]
PPVEGVSGATMTSQAMATAIAVAARETLQAEVQLRRQQDAQQRTAGLQDAAQQWEQNRQPRTWSALLTLRSASTICLTLLGILIGVTHLRGQRRVRTFLQGTVIVWLGLVNGDMVSQAQLLGWAQHGVPWQSGVGLVCLTGAAVLLPVVSGRNVYCSHLCPHGAVQQLVRRRIRWQFHPSHALTRLLKCIPGLLLLWVASAGIFGLAVRAVAIEPFDAWLWRTAGLATITIAIVGLTASLFVPMAYCRFGCPTGGLLEFLRRNSGTRISPSDIAAGLLALIGLIAVMTGA